MSLPAFNPMGSSFSMPGPPPGYQAYIDSLKNIPKNKNIGHRSVLPLDKAKLEAIQLSDLKKLNQEANQKKILPISYYQDKANKGVHSEPHTKDTIKKSTTPNIDPHDRKHVPTDLENKKAVLEAKLAEKNATRLEQGMGALTFKQVYPGFYSTKINMNLPKPKPTPTPTSKPSLPKKPRVDAMGFPLDGISIADAVRNPTLNIKNNNSGSYANPTFSQY